MNKPLLTLVSVGLLGISTLTQADNAWSFRDYNLYAGDFNGDGVSDILYIAHDARRVNGIALSDGSGFNVALQSWGNAYLGIPWPSGEYNIIVADFDGDRRDDLFLQRQTAGDHYLLLAEDGGIGAIYQTIPQDAMGLAWSADAHAIVAGDFNGDGRSDLFLQATDVDGLNAVVLADSSGQFTSAVPVQSWNSKYAGFNWLSSKALVFAGDFNGDGRDDLLLQAKPLTGTGPGTRHWAVFPPNMNGVVLAQKGGGIFTTEGIQAWSEDGFAARWSPLRSKLFVGDFNGDDRSDVLLQGRTATDVSYLLHGNAPGAIFESAIVLDARALPSAAQARPIAGRFSSAESDALYLQAIDRAGKNVAVGFHPSGVSVGMADASLPLNTQTLAADIGADSTTAPPGGVSAAALAVTAVGRTDGQFSVSPAGMAGYSIPIAVPPGVSGIEPNIAIAYVGGTTNGVLGVGWDLAGFSQINRCNKTLAQDGSNNSPQLVAADAYCLDGSKLRLTSGTYGAAGSTYQTEMEQFSRITAYSNGGPSAAGPGYFIAETKSGLKYLYGNFSTAVDDVSLPTVWLVRKVTDRSGNYMTFSYVGGTAGLSNYPTRIDYTSNDAVSLVPAFSVIFTYELRPTNDIITMMSLGDDRRQHQRLSKISTTTYSGTTIRRYLLTYDNSGSNPRSRLASIQECDATTNCLAPTVIGWRGGQIGVGPDVTAANLGSLGKNAQPIDVNGDGRADVVYPSSTTNTWWLMMAQASGGYAAATNTLVAHNNNYAKAIALDYNIDGKMDLLVPNASNQWQVLRSTGTGFTVVSTGFAATGAGGNAWIADVNGDGYSDLVFANTTFTQLQARFNSASGFSSTVTTLYTVPTGSTIMTGQASTTASAYYYSVVSQADFNADGRSDLLIGLRSNNIPVPKILMSAGTAYVDSTYTFSDVRNGQGLSEVMSSWRPLDANADGYSDLAFIDSAGVWKVLYGSPAATPTLRLWKVTASNVARTTGGVASGSKIAIDWDADGRGDILVASDAQGTNPGGYWKWIRATGDTKEIILGGTGSMTTSTGTTGILTQQSQTMAVDVNADGLVDLAYVDTSNNFHYLLRNGPFPDLVSSIADGYGNTVSFNYAPLTNSAVYTKGTGAVYPEIDLIAPVYVVQSYSVTDGIGGNYTITRSYSGARIDLRGRGFKGMGTVVETDSRTGVVSTTTYNQTFPFAGTVATHTIAQANGKTIRQTTYHYTDLVTNPTQYADRHYPYVDSVTQNIFEVSASNPSIDGAAITRTTTSTQIDSYGTPTSVTENTYDMTTGAPVLARTMVTAAQVTNEAGYWCLGFVTQQTVTSTVPGLPAQTRTVAFVRDASALDKCRPSQKIIEPATPITANTVTSGFTYDAYGHVATETVSALGIANRTTSTSYGTQGIAPTSVTNAENEITTTAYNYGLGVPSSITDSNQLTTIFTYDPFGRKSSELRPDGTRTTWTISACNSGNAFCGDPLLRYQVVEQQLDTAGIVSSTSVDFFDSLGRSKYQQSESITGAISIVLIRYDALGRLSQQSTPYFSGSTTTFTTVRYDLLGRKLSEERPVSDTDPTLQSSTYSYNRLSATFTDANQKATTRVSNALDQVIRVTDPNSGITRYQYDQFGNQTVTEDPAGHQSISDYNIRGFKNFVNDPDMGLWSYTYYGTGEVKTQTDAKGQITSLTYDRVGRTKTRTDADSTITTWTYGASIAAKNVGKPTLVSMSNGLYSDAYTYDSLGRPLDLTTTIDSTAYVVSYSYATTTGAVDTVTYPTSTSAVPNSRFKVRYEYAYGLVKSVKDANGQATIYWQNVNANAAGQVIEELYGNGLRTFSNHDSINGQLRSIATGNAGSVQNLSYAWDKVGNLTERSDLKQSLKERFYYDNLYRLDYSTLQVGTQAPFINQDLAYDSQGNITSKLDVGSYNYTTQQPGCTYTTNGQPNAPQPHAVRSAGGTSYCYDANGSMTRRGSDLIVWKPFNMVAQVNQGANSASYFYGAGRTRYKQVTVTASGGALPAGTESTVYVGAFFEKVTKPLGVIEYRHNLRVGQNTVALRTLRSNGVNETRYLHKDHLGGIDTITNESGAVVGTLSFDAFGKRRNANGWVGAPTPAQWATVANLTHRGFTGHEHIDNVELINMNGRVYDPRLGRFLSADPTTQAPFMSQNLNRYTYVMNNPLSLVDPSGFSFLSRMFSSLWKGIKGFFDMFGRMIIGVAIAVYAPHVLAAYLTSFQAALAAGVLAGAVVTGTWEGALLGGLTAALFFGAGSLAADWSAPGRAVAHAGAGCLSSMSGGGSCGSGALSAGFANYVGGKLPVPQDQFVRAMRQGILGGIASSLGGGLFGAGFATGFAGSAFNDSFHERMLKGLRAHQAIQDEIKSIFAESTTFDVKAEVRIRSLNPFSKNFLRVDLLITDGEFTHVFEIKPDTYSSEVSPYRSMDAQRQLARYVGSLNASYRGNSVPLTAVVGDWNRFLPGIGHLTASSPYFSGSVVFGPDSSAQGIILYKWACCLGP